MVDLAIPLRHKDAPTDIKEALDDPCKAVIATIIADVGHAYTYGVCIVIAEDPTVAITDAESATAIGYQLGHLLKAAPTEFHVADLLRIFNEAVGDILNGEYEVL